MKRIVIILVLFCSKMYSQDTIHYPKVDDFRRVYFELAIQKPQGDLSDKYNKSYNAGIWFRNKIKKTQFVDLGIELNFLNEPRTIDYRHADSIIKFESNKVGLKIGFRYSRIIPFSRNNPDFNVESNTGLGWSVLYYGVSEEVYGEEIRNKFDSKTDLHTIFLSQTIKLNIYDFGIFCSYYLSPYTTFRKNHENHFGSDAIAIGVVYRL